MKIHDVFKKFRILILLLCSWPLLSCVDALFGRFSNPSPDDSSPLVAANVDTIDIGAYLNEQLLKPFSVGPTVDHNDIVAVISARFEMALKKIETEVKQNKHAFKGQRLELSTVMASLRQVFVPQVQIDAREGIVVYPPEIYVKHKDPYVLPEILVVPLLTRMVTKVIRQSSSRESLVKGALQATSMGSGPIKMLVFKSLQKEYPFMDPSGRLDNVYTVAEFHARTLTTFYIDDMNDLRALLAISDLKTRMPSLQRIQTNFKILGHLAQSVTCLSAFSPGYFPTIDLVLTDKMTDLTELKGLLTTYPAFAQYVSGIGFSQSIPNVSMLGEVIKILPKNKSIEIDSNFLQNHHLQTLKSLRQKIVLRPGLLVEELNTYLGRHHAYRLDVSIPMNGKLIEQKNKIINLLEGWSRSGISLGLTMETKSLLAMPEKK